MSDTEKMNDQDHDLLIRLDTKMDRATQDIGALHKQLGDVAASVHGLIAAVDSKIAAAVAQKVDKHEFHEAKVEGDKVHSDHEQRIRRIERYVWLAIGALALLQMIIPFVTP